jgi:ABC-2 type transport system ATP-binding protein
LLQERSLGDVVEFGCGTGYWTRVIARNAQQVIATDLSDNMLEVAQNQLRGFRNVRLQKADCARAPLLQGGCDCVLMANLLHVMDRPLQCLLEGYRILREGGVLLAVDFTSYGMRVSQKVTLGLRYLAKWGLPPRQGRDDMSPDELALIVESAGFKVQNVQLMEAGSNALYLRGQKGPR